MSLNLYRMQVALMDDSNLARDQYVNTFHLVHDGGDGPLPEITPAFHQWVLCAQGFYNGVKGYLSDTVSGNLGTVKIYDLRQPLESPPVWSEPIDLFGLSGIGPGDGKTSLPNEVACCLTYHGQPQGGQVQRQSWRGRVYLGPLNVSASENTSAKHSRPVEAFRVALANAGSNLHAALVNANAEWVIASKVQQTVYPILNFYVDDAWDTIRSRGDRPTTQSKTTAAGHTAAFPAGAPIAHAVR